MADAQNLHVKFSQLKIITKKLRAFYTLSAIFFLLPKAKSRRAKKDAASIVNAMIII